MKNKLGRVHVCLIVLVDAILRKMNRYKRMLLLSIFLFSLRRNGKHLTVKLPLWRKFPLGDFMVEEDLPFL